MEIPIDPYHNHLSLQMLLTNNINGVINWLYNSANFGPARKDGTPVNRMMVTRSWFDVYSTTGLGKNEYESKMDCVVQITQLMKENFGVSRLGSHKLPINTKCFNDLPNAIYVAENSSMFPREQSEKLGVLGYFLDTRNSKLPLQMLYDISNIMLTRSRETMTNKSGMHVCKHYVNLYCSTGLGLTADDARTRSAEQMLNTLRLLCGFVPAFKLPGVGDPENDGNDHRMWLTVPTDDQYKILLIKYFLESSSVPHTVQINELAAMLKVVVKYSDSGHDSQLAVACEFGPHVTVGVGPSKMVSVFRARTAMLNKLKLVCGFEQYPRTFVPLDCIDSTMGENREKNCGYGKQKDSNLSFLQADHLLNEATPAEHLEYTMSNLADTAATFAHNLTSTYLQPTASIGEPIEIVMRDGAIVRGAFNPILGWDCNNYHANSPPRQRRGRRRRRRRCLNRVSMLEEFSENSDLELDAGQ